MFGVILGTGVGGGCAIDGRLIDGANAIAGEWGHNPLPWPTSDELPGAPCWCGKLGCIETFLSGPAFEAEWREAGNAELSVPEIVRRSGHDRAAARLLARYEHRLARALATTINVFDPEIIVLGGGLSNIDRLYENVPKLWQEFAFSDEIQTSLRRAQHGDASGVRGAAWLWPADLSESNRA